MAFLAIIGQAVGAGVNYFGGKVANDKAESAFIAAKAQSEAAASQQKQLIMYVAIAAIFLFLIYYLSKKKK